MAVVRAARRTRGERGSMAVEVVILTPVLAFVLLIVACGRYVAVKGEVEATARDAVRAASWSATRGGAGSGVRRGQAPPSTPRLSCSGATCPATSTPGR